MYLTKVKRVCQETVTAVRDKQVCQISFSLIQSSNHYELNELIHEVQEGFYTNAGCKQQQRQRIVLQRPAPTLTTFIIGS